MVIFLNLIILITSAYIIPTLTDSSGMALLAWGPAQGQACARHFPYVRSLALNPFLLHSQLHWSYYLMFLSFFLSAGKWALLYVLSPITRFVTCYLSVLLVSKDTTFSRDHYLLKWYSFLLYSSREPFVPTSLVFFYRLYIFWHISNLKMVGHSELCTYFKFVYLYQMKMFTFRGLLIEIGEELLSIFSFLKGHWILH